VLSDLLFAELGLPIGAAGEVDDLGHFSERTMWFLERDTGDLGTSFPTTLSPYGDNLGPKGPKGVLAIAMWRYTS